MFKSDGFQHHPQHIQMAVSKNEEFNTSRFTNGVMGQGIPE
jgi:hypothetical protein